MNVDVDDVQYNEKKRLNSLSNLLQETTDMHMDVMYLHDQPRDYPRDKRHLSHNWLVG